MCILSQQSNANAFLVQQYVSHVKVTSPIDLGLKCNGHQSYHFIHEITAHQIVVVVTLVELPHVICGAIHGRLPAIRIPIQPPPHVIL